MSLGPDFIETMGETVEEAISKGLAELGVSPSQVMIEVLEEPGGLFGGSQAKVRLQLIGGRPVMPPAPTSAPPAEMRDTPRRERESQRANGPSRDHDTQDEPRAREPQKPRDRDGEKPAGRSGGRAEKPERQSRSERGERPNDRTPKGEPKGERPQRGQNRERIAAIPPEPIEDLSMAASSGALEKKPYFDLDVDDKDENLPLLYTPDEVPEAEQDDEAQVSKVVLNELLERMSVRAQVVVRRATPGEQGGKSPWVLDVNAGRNLSRLIGRRGETLAALQYVTRLIASRELQRRVDIVVDVESYKVKRAATLHSLALRMAEEAINAGRTITLEPMPPHERRIIHLALRGREDVVTKSVGEGQSRKVTIVPQSELS